MIEMIEIVGQIVFGAGAWIAMLMLISAAFGGKKPRRNG